MFKISIGVIIFLSKFINAALNSGTMTMCTNGEEVISFGYVFNKCYILSTGSSQMTKYTTNTFTNYYYHNLDCSGNAVNVERTNGIIF